MLECVAFVVASFLNTLRIAVVLVVLSVEGRGARAPMVTPLGFLDTHTCEQIGSTEPCVDLWSSLVCLGPFPEEGVCFQDADFQVHYLDRDGLIKLMSCQWAGHLLLEDHRLLHERDLWAFPPPVSPSDPFGRIPSSEDAGCAELLRSGDFLFHHLYVASVGVVDGIDVGLGLFAMAEIPQGTVLGEYTGVLSRRVSEDDGVYGYGLPVVDPDLVINAKDFGNLCRLINHSEDEWNAELITVHHEGMLHVVCRVVSDIVAGQQVLIHYGARYWRVESRCRVQLSRCGQSGRVHEAGGYLSH